MLEKLDVEPQAAKDAGILPMPRWLWWLSFIGMMVILVLSRLTFAWTAVHRVLHLVDELDLTLGALDRFLGIPMANTSWPGMVNQLLLVPMFGAQYLFVSQGHPSPDGFFNFLSATYRDPWHALFIGRLIVVAVSSIGLSMLAIWLGKEIRSMTAAILMVLLLASVPEIWFYSVLGLGNGVAIGLMCIATAFAISPRDDRNIAFTRPVVVGVFAGLALASRNTMLPYVLFLIALMLWRDPRRPISRFIVFGLVIGIVVILTCAPIWIDPIRWLKATLGNYQRHGAPTGLFGAVRVLLAATPLWLVVLGSLATVLSLVQRQWALGIGVILCVGMMIVGASRSSIVQPRYFHSVILCLGVVSIIVLGNAMVGYIRSAKRGTGLIAAAALAFLALAALDIKETLGMFAGIQFPKEQILQLRITLENSHGKTIAIPLEYFPYVADLISSDSLAKIEAKCMAGVVDGTSVKDFLGTYGFSPEVARVMATNFNEKEVAFGARLRVMMVDQAPKPVHAVIYAPPATAVRFGLETADGVFDLVRSHQIAGVLVRAAERPPHMQGSEIAPGLLLVTNISAENR